MDAITISRALTNWTVANSGHEPRRKYIGLSGIGGCERAMYETALHGGTMSVGEHLRTRISFELEAAVIGRLREMHMYGEREEISLFNGMVQGHTDGTISVTQGALPAVLEIKTVARMEYFPRDERLPRKVYWQIQAYMHYLQREEGIVIYLERANGDLRVYRVWKNARIGQEIEEKVARVMLAVKNYEPPACSCGNCGKSELEWLEADPPTVEGDTADNKY